MIERRAITINGAVQGVGFRPFIYRLALTCGVHGWVINAAQGVQIEAEGESEQLDAFLNGIGNGKPAHATIRDLRVQLIPPVGDSAFEIRSSATAGVKTVDILPDLATCPDCLRELLDPNDRRYRYPFINCTHCGTRYSIIEALPYDRINTTMRRFPMCDTCRAEYENPLDRRFHAQPNACPDCGPHLEVWSGTGTVLEQRDDALLHACEAIRAGRIVALKGLGGFQLIVDGRNEDAVARLRQRKDREAKPFALMMPTLRMAREWCEVSDLEADLLASAAAPIVLLRSKGGEAAANVAPGNPYLGVMLPYTPLHHLLMCELRFPIVATSGNRSGEPICIDEREALVRLGDIADLFLVHDRPIARHVDDSVVRVMAGLATVLRRARGYAPAPIALSADKPLIAVGAHLKNTVAVTVGDRAIVSQHIGDLDSAETDAAFKQTADDLQRLYDLKPEAIVCDLHPDYRSSQHARESGLPVIAVQHHYAHVTACIAEHRLEAPVLGVSWDGTGYGTDGTIWGGEWFHITTDGWARAAHLRQFRLPGGDLAVREPRRSALGVLYELYRDFPPDLAPVQSFTPAELKLIKTALAKGINAPLTSSMGRLFDAVAALLGLYPRVSFEGQAAMALEFAADGTNSEECYPYAITDITSGKGGSGGMIDWTPLALAMIDDVRSNATAGSISAKFHNTLAAMVVSIAERVGTEQVVLTGGCFQNVMLLEKAVARLKNAGFRPYWHRQIPPNDGGIAIGQLAAAIKGESRCV